MREVVKGSTHLVRADQGFKVIRGTSEPYSYSDITTGDVLDLSEEEFDALVKDRDAILKAEKDAAAKPDAAQKAAADAKATGKPVPVPASLVGSVHDATGAPVAGASITTQGHATTSQADGRYSILGLTAGLASVAVTAQGYQPSTKSLTLNGQTVADFSLVAV